MYVPPPTPWRDSCRSLTRHIFRSRGLSRAPRSLYITTSPCTSRSLFQTFGKILVVHPLSVISPPAPEPKSHRQSPTAAVDNQCDVSTDHGLTPGGGQTRPQHLNYMLLRGRRRLSQRASYKHTYSHPPSAVPRGSRFESTATPTGALSCRCT